jgi:hypothetical protein
MKLPKINSFFWIGVILVAISLIAFSKGPSFRFDAGVPAEPHEAVYYLITGLVMIANGFVNPHPLPEEENKENK